MAKLRQTVLANRGYKAFWNRLNSIIGVSLLPVGPTASLLLPNLKQIFKQNLVHASIIEA